MTPRTPELYLPQLVLSAVLCLVVGMVATVVAGDDSRVTNVGVLLIALGVVGLVLAIVLRGLSKK